MGIDGRGYPEFIKGHYHSINHNPALNNLSETVFSPGSDNIPGLKGGHQKRIESNF